MKSAFITGVTGQDGAYLAKLLLEKGYDVHGGVRRISHPVTERLQRLGIADQIKLVDFDLAEVNCINRIIRDGQYDEFYNLAAQSFVGSSWDQPAYVADVNGIAVLRMLDAIRTYAPHTRFYQASTSEMFGEVHDVPQRETTLLHPRSPYGAAKVYGHYITKNYRESYGLHATSGILFNHESPLRGSEFVTRKITKTLAGIARGSGEKLVLGNLDPQRDWGFAGDYVEGMWRMMQEDAADDYVLATGVTTKIRDFVDFAATALDFEIEWSGEGVNEVGIDRKSGQKVVEVSESFFRPAEVDLLIGDPSKVKQKTGWAATVQVDELAQMMARADYDLAV